MAFKNKFYVECLLSVNVLNASCTARRRNTQPRVGGGSHHLPPSPRRQGDSEGKDCVWNFLAQPQKGQSRGPHPRLPVSSSPPSSLVCTHGPRRHTHSVQRDALLYITQTKRVRDVFCRRHVALRDSGVQVNAGTEVLTSLRNPSSDGGWGKAFLPRITALSVPYLEGRRRLLTVTITVAVEGRGRERRGRERKGREAGRPGPRVGRPRRSPGARGSGATAFPSSEIIF